MYICLYNEFLDPHLLSLLSEIYFHLLYFKGAFNYNSYSWIIYEPLSKFLCILIHYIASLYWNKYKRNLQNVKWLFSHFTSLRTLCRRRTYCCNLEQDLRLVYILNEPGCNILHFFWKWANSFKM